MARLFRKKIRKKITKTPSAFTSVNSSYRAEYRRSWLDRWRSEERAKHSRPVHRFARSQLLAALTLALGELEAAARLGLTVLFALDDTRIARKEAAALEHRAQIRLVAHQRLGQAVTHRAGLT
jgi:hypothetical protein